MSKNDGLNRREIIAAGLGSLFMLTTEETSAQTTQNLTFWTVRLNTPELSAALKSISRRFREGESDDQDHARAGLGQARLSEVPDRDPRPVDAGRRGGLFLPSAAVRRARPDGADGRHHRGVEEERPASRDRQRIRLQEILLERPLLGRALQPRHPRRSTTARTCSRRRASRRRRPGTSSRPRRSP